MSTNPTKKAPRETTVAISILKFVPLFVFAGLVIFCKMDLLLAGPIATLVAIVVCMYVNRSSFDDAFNFALKAAASIVQVFFILMFAYGVAECFMATGVGAVVINIALSAGVTGKTIAVVALIVTCILSIATGTSWGTFAACAPIFFWMNYIIGGNLILTLGAVAGGSCFGDNIGMISDTTVLSCGMQDIKIIDRVKHQGVWSILCVAAAIIVTFLMSMSLPGTQADINQALAAIPEEAYAALAEERPAALILLEQVQTGVPIYMIIPLLAVIVVAFMGVNTLLALGAGMVSALILGCAAGTCTLQAWLEDMLLVGFGGAGEWSIVMMCWVAGFGGVMNSMNAFEPLAKLVVKMSGKVRSLMGWCGVLCLVGNVALADETAQIATISPIVRNIVEENVEGSEEDMYKLRVRLATFNDALGVYGSELIPWHSFPVFFCAIANAVYPIGNFTTLDIARCNIMSMIMVASILIFTFTGLDRFIPMFGLPGEPNVRMKNRK